MKQLYILIILVLFMLATGCKSNMSPATTVDTLRSADFNTSGSDEKAMKIAESVVKAAGGAQNYTDTEYLSWNFFGSRKHVWHKPSGDIYIEALKSPIKIKMNINTKKGDVWIDDQKQMEQDSLDKYLQKGYEWWVNDSYWLVFPFKLQDSGVTLKYVGQDTTQMGQDAEILSLTFANVGVTPENKYLVYVDKQTNLVSQWDFYAEATDEAPRFQIPWLDYKDYGQIKLSGNRGRMNISDISVEDRPNVFK